MLQYEVDVANENDFAGVLVWAATHFPWVSEEAALAS